jgi:hypothetical protein
MPGVITSIFTVQIFPTNLLRVIATTRGNHKRCKQTWKTVSQSLALVHFSLHTFRTTLRLQYILWWLFHSRSKQKREITAARCTAEICVTMHLHGSGTDAKGNNFIVSFLCQARQGQNWLSSAGITDRCLNGPHQTEAVLLIYFEGMDSTAVVYSQDWYLLRC